MYLKNFTKKKIVDSGNTYFQTNIKFHPGKPFSPGLRCVQRDKSTETRLIVYIGFGKYTVRMYGHVPVHVLICLANTAKTVRVRGIGSFTSKKNIIIKIKQPSESPHMILKLKHILC